MLVDREEWSAEKARLWCRQHWSRCLSIEWIFAALMLLPLADVNRTAFNCIALAYFLVRLPWRGSWPWKPPKRGWW